MFYLFQLFEQTSSENEKIDEEREITKTDPHINSNENLVENKINSSETLTVEPMETGNSSANELLCGKSDDGGIVKVISDHSSNGSTGSKSPRSSHKSESLASELQENHEDLFPEKDLQVEINKQSENNQTCFATEDLQNYRSNLYLELLKVQQAIAARKQVCAIKQ